ncbi:MAG: hypothetical protein JO028_13450 [Acidobacteriaceae bacterium]|nr:hypothetical protein [Acidobacteriaceae bacterium]
MKEPRTRTQDPIYSGLCSLPLLVLASEEELVLGNAQRLRDKALMTGVEVNLVHFARNVAQLDAARSLVAGSATAIEAVGASIRRRMVLVVRP